MLRNYKGPFGCRQAIVVAIILLLSAHPCFGWADSWEDLRAAAGSITSISATFVQEKHMKILIRPLTSAGRLFFQPPDSLRWEYQRPIQSILLAHAGETKKYIRKDGKILHDAAASAPVMQFIIEEISRWLKGRFDENPVFAASLEAGRRIVLTPNYEGIGDIIQRIEIGLSARPGIMESVVIYESEHSYTRLLFTNVEVNRPLERRLFEEIQ